MVLQEKLLTADDLWALAHQPENTGKRFELVEGALREMSPVGGTHGIVALKIGALLLAYAEQGGSGVVTVETGYYPAGDRHNVFAPDVAFVNSARVPVPFPSKYVPLMPDLAVEVISPTDSAPDTLMKLQRYFAAGTRIVWTVYPNERTVYVWQSAAAGGLHAQPFGPDDTLDGGSVLPGFAVQVSALFPTT
jgi:Uma2 family endonuclease